MLLLILVPHFVVVTLVKFTHCSYYKENDKTFEFKKHVSTETSVIFS